MQNTKPLLINLIRVDEDTNELIDWLPIVEQAKDSTNEVFREKVRQEINDRLNLVVSIEDVFDQLLYYLNQAKKELEDE